MSEYCLNKDESCENANICPCLDYESGKSAKEPHIVNKGGLLSRDGKSALSDSEICPWCDAEYTIIDYNLHEQVMQDMIKHCFHCGRKLRANK